jgi:hypothetical protein
MTHERWSSSDAELTSALRALYSTPGEETYWDALEARIIAHVARANESRVWWAELSEMARPGLVAAAALIFAASAALAHSRQDEVASAYSSVISPTPADIEPATRAASIGDGDGDIHYITSR